MIFRLTIVSRRHWQNFIQNSGDASQVHPIVNPPYEAIVNQAGEGSYASGSVLACSSN